MVAQKIRQRAGALAIESFFELFSRLASVTPSAKKLRRTVAVEHDLVYGDSRPYHLLDVYRPRAALPSPRPALLYLHGGAFRILSKETHWLMASLFARAGYVVFNANYRLAPTHPFPAALEDAARAFTWVQDNAARFGADPKQLIIAGESAGANLALALTVCTTFEREEAYAQQVFARGVVPKAVIPMCGILQVSDTERLIRRKPHMRRLISDRLISTEKSYIGGQASFALADPLNIIESSRASARPLPPMYAAVGTADPLLDDTRRLQRALQMRRTPIEARYFENEIHAFHALTWRPAARLCWREQLSFLARTLA
jgi:acetyl esterase